VCKIAHLFYVRLKLLFARWNNIELLLMVHFCRVDVLLLDVLLLSTFWYSTFCNSTFWYSTFCLSTFCMWSWKAKVGDVVSLYEFLTDSNLGHTIFLTYLTGAPGKAGKSSFDIWNSEECSDGCFTIPTRRQKFLCRKLVRYLYSIIFWHNGTGTAEIP
jgi:hypothetical protein